MKQIDGAWTGWSGDTIVQLTDGSVWRQAEYHYEYHYAYRPKVEIVSNKMQVAGCVSRFGYGGSLSPAQASRAWTEHTFECRNARPKWRAPATLKRALRRRRCERGGGPSAR